MKRIRTLNVASTADHATVEEAAEFLGLKPTVIRNYLHDGRLTTWKFKGYTLLSFDELKDYKKEQKR